MPAVTQTMNPQLLLAIALLPLVAAILPVIGTTAGGAR